MKFIRDQIEAAITAIKVEKPILKLVKNYYNAVSLELNDKPKWDEIAVSSIDKLVITTVSQRVRVKLIMDDNRYQVSVDADSVVDNILYTIEQYILNFIRTHGGFTNNRLSKLFKWYRDNMDRGVFYRNEKYTQDLYNIAKFVGDHPTEEQIKAARTLLVLIKDRYESALK